MAEYISFNMQTVDGLILSWGDRNKGLCLFVEFISTVLTTLLNLQFFLWYFAFIFY